jgi:exodeoxyribonuclease VII large subunit
MYRFDGLRAQRFLKEGQKIQIFGRATVWAPRGRLQFVAQNARPFGRGALLLAFEELKKKLASEGLFEASRKRRLPSDPKIVGVVTSSTGAAFHDIRSVAFRRSRLRLVLAPALVQGEGAPESLLAALDRIERYPGLDVVIVGRGGGSGEDLMAFNDERVARRIASMRVPVVSAVGHETDVSLADLAADVRASTPSQAAELVVPDRVSRLRALSSLQTSLVRGMKTHLISARSVIERQRGRLGDPRFVVAEREQELSELFARLRQLNQRSLSLRRRSISKLMTQLFGRHPRAVIAENRARLLPIAGRMQAAHDVSLARRREDLGMSLARLHALSPLAVLGRGYALVFRDDGRLLRRATDARIGERLMIRLEQGSLEAEISKLESLDVERD